MSRLFLSGATPSDQGQRHFGEISAVILLPKNGFASWWVSDQMIQPHQRIGKGRVLPAISKGILWEYFPKQCFPKQRN